MKDLHDIVNDMLDLVETRDDHSTSFIERRSEALLIEALRYSSSCCGPRQEDAARRIVTLYKGLTL